MILVAVMFSTGMTACGDDDDDPADPTTHDHALIGRWSNSISGSDGSWTEEAIVEFHKNGKYDSKTVYKDEDGTEIEKSGGNWSTSNNILTVECTYATDKDEIGEVSRMAYAVTGNTLVIDGEVFTKQ